MIEEWRDIKGYEGLYQVSNLGRVKRLRKVIIRTSKLGNKYEATIEEKLMCPCDNGKGYLKVTFRNSQPLVHRLVAQAFIPNPDNLPEVNHKDENKQNNIVDNLEWCDRLYNVRYGTGLERQHKSLIGKHRSKESRLKQSLSMKKHIIMRKQNNTYWLGKN